MAPTILLPTRYQGGTGALQGRGTRGRESRLKQVRKTFDHLPAWRCESVLVGPKGEALYVYHLCGKCFQKRGDGPARSLAEMWVAGDPLGKLIPKDARCEDCGGRAWPSD